MAWEFDCIVPEDDGYVCLTEDGRYVEGNKGDRVKAMCSLDDCDTYIVHCKENVTAIFEDRDYGSIHCLFLNYIDFSSIGTVRDLYNMLPTREELCRNMHFYAVLYGHDLYDAMEEADDGSNTYMVYEFPPIPAI